MLRRCSELGHGVPGRGGSIRGGVGSARVYGAKLVAYGSVFISIVGAKGTVSFSKNGSCSPTPRLTSPYQLPDDSGVVDHLLRDSLYHYSGISIPLLRYSRLIIPIQSICISGINLPLLRDLFDFIPGGKGGFTRMSAHGPYKSLILF